MSNNHSDTQNDLSNPAALANQLLENFWEQTSDYICAILDGDGTIVGWRGAAEQVLGFAEHEAIGKPIDLIFTEEDEQLGIPGLERSMASANGRAEDDRWHIRRDGARIWISGTLVAIQKGGGVIGFVKVMRDRTDLKSQLESLRNRNELLEQRLVGRDISFARVAHEIRNALAPLNSATDILRKLPGQPAASQPLMIIKRQLALIGKMAHDLAEVAQVSAGKLRLSRTHFDIGATLSEICAAVQGRAQAKDQTLSLLAPPAALTLWADRERIHQVVFNLIDNALKYTPKNGHIWVKCLAEDRTAIIKVEDDGVGIAPDTLPLIFNLFTQEMPEASPAGFGVGLSLVKDLVEAHDGVIEVRSDGKGKGSEFTVRLPLLSRDELAQT